MNREDRGRNMTATSAENTTKSKASAPKVWNTKYGRRRVKQALPTLEEAIFAAKGITDDLKSQVEIAAELMGMSPEEVRPQVMKSSQLQLRQRPDYLPSIVAMEDILSCEKMGGTAFLLFERKTHRWQKVR